MTASAKLRRLTDGRDFPLDQPTTTIGRDASEPIHLDLSAVSRRHAEVARTPHGYVIRDLDSRNGTFVNGERIDGQARPLRHDDEIVVAGAETLRFLDPMATPATVAVGRLTGVWIDPDSGAVWVDGQPLEPALSDRQQALLELLDTNLDRFVSRQEIIEVVWSDAAADGVSAEAIDALVKRLRARLRPLQLHGDQLEVRRGRGVRLRRS